MLPKVVNGDVSIIYLADTNGVGEVTPDLGRGCASSIPWWVLTILVIMGLFCFMELSWAYFLGGRVLAGESPAVTKGVVD